MATASLPERPDFAQLRTQARELQRAIRAGDDDALRRAGLDQAAPEYPLHRAQLALARHYGFASWARLRRHVEAIAARTWLFTAPPPDESSPDAFLRRACLNYADDDPAYRADAARFLAEHPEIPQADLAVACVCANVDEVRRRLRADPGAAQTPTGPFAWSPLMYAAYARLPVDEHPVDEHAAVTTMQLLLDAGADPNDGRFFLGLPTPFTVLTGVFGGGEGDQPAHPHSIALARVLLAAGAEPNDGQTLYNRMFRADDDFLEVLFEYGLGRGDGGPWRRALPDLLPTPAEMLASLLDWAVTHDQRERVLLLARHGVDVVGARADGTTPIASALRTGHRELAAQLEALGADAPALDPVDAFVAAALAGDAAAVRATPAAVVEAARQRRPALVVWAAGQERLDAVGLLVATGFDVNARGRADIPVEQEWQTALHTAVERGNAALARRLLELGADPTIHDARFDATPLDWADHFGNSELAEVLRS